MDSGSHSPVLLQHSSPPHILSTHDNVQSTLPNFQNPTNIAAVGQNQQTVLPEDQPPTTAMEEPPPHTNPLDREDAISSGVENSETSSIQPPENEGAPISPQPDIATQESPVGTSADSTDATEPVEGTAQQSPPATESPEHAHSTPDSLESAAIIETESNTPTTDPDPPPPPPVVEEPQVAVPEWVTFREDKTEITEEELKNIEGTDADTSALDVQHFEQKIYAGVDDPEQRPVKKLRLSWTIKGVRGTKERPNYARVMNSPAICVDGFYWYIKFFPRGNNASHLSTYIKCTPVLPKPDAEVPEGTFKAFQGPPDVNLGDIEPVVALSIAATAPKEDEPTSAESEEMSEPDSKKVVVEIPTDTSTASAIE